MINLVGNFVYVVCVFIVVFLFLGFAFDNTRTCSTEELIPVPVSKQQLLPIPLVVGITNLEMG